MKLLTSQKNRLFDLIIEFGFSPLQFNFSAGETVDSIHFKNSNYHFDFTEYSNAPGRLAYYSPANQEFSRFENFKDWDDCIRIFRIWLDSLKFEISFPDKWTQLNEETKNIPDGLINKFGTSDFFTISEYELLSEKIETLKLKISTVETLAQHQKEFNQKLDHLLEMSKTLSKIDWKELFLGSIISLILSLSIDHKTVNQIWVFVKDFFSSILYLN